MSGERLLVVDDEENLRSMLCAALRHHGFEVVAATDGSEALDKLADASPDLVLLDVMMPGVDGFEVCRRMRARHDHTPVMFLTARGETTDKVRGLKLGGDDYLEKPFSLEELIARIEAVLRRTGAATSNVAELEDLRVDDDAHLVTRGGKPIHLSPTEYRLLHYLLTNQRRVLSKTQILEAVWGYDFEGDGRIVETYVGYLRRKIDTTKPQLIHTVRGIGYTMRVEP